MLVEDKVQLRKTFIVRRKGLSKDDVSARSRPVQARLFDFISETSPDQIFFYCSHQNEPDLDSLISSLSSKITVGLPRISSFESRTMSFHRWSPEDPLKTNRYGLREPSKEATVLVPSAETLLCIPAVAIDRRGMRIGYGGGFYDRFLVGHPNLSRIGVVFDDFFVEKVPTEALDLPVNYICTEKTLLRSEAPRSV